MIRDTSSQDRVLEKNHTQKAWVITAVCALLLMLMVSVSYRLISNWLSDDHYIDKERIRTAIVTRGEFIRDIALQGRIVAANSPKLYSPAVGTVTYLVQPGQKVAPGTLVARVNSPDMTNQLQQEQATLKSMEIILKRKKIEARQEKFQRQQQTELEKVALEAANREYRRAQKSIEISAISQIEYEKAQDDLKRAELAYTFSLELAQLSDEQLAFELKTSEFELNQFALQVENTQRLVNGLDIVSPVAGIVGSWAADQKSNVNANQSLMTIVDLSAFEVELSVPESYVDELGIGMQAKIHHGNEAFDGTVTRISPEVINNVVSARVAFNGQTPPGIKQNQRVNSHVIIDQKKNVLYVPRGSFLRHHAGQKIFVVEADMANLTDIDIGANSINKIEILSGLSEGQRVIVSNTDFAKDATRLVLN